MNKKSLKWYNDLTLEKWYHSMANYKDRIRLPPHEVVYVRAAIRAATGKIFSYEQVYNALKAEGWNKD